MADKLIEAVERRAEIKREIQELQLKARDLEAVVVEMLIDNKMLDMFRVDWARLERTIRIR